LGVDSSWAGDISEEEKKKGRRIEVEEAYV
jgi:hypothetical protein